MLAALIAGERDPRVLADLAKGKMRRKIPDLAEALTGHFDDHHALLARSDAAPARARSRRRWPSWTRSSPRPAGPWAHQLELLQTIPGVGAKVAQVIIAETGGDMSRFPTAAHLAAWAGVAPAMHESAGKRSPAGPRHGNKWLASMLVEAAGSVGRMKGDNYLAAQHARLDHPPRHGAGPQVAVAHSILVSAYYMLTRDEPYRELGPDWLGPPQRRGPHPPAGRPARTPRPHRGPRPRRLTQLHEEQEDGLRPPRADARLQRTYSRVLRRPVILLLFDGG